MKRKYNRKSTILICSILVLVIAFGLTKLSFKLQKESRPTTLINFSNNNSSHYKIEKESGEKIIWTDNSSGNDFRTSYNKFNGTEIRSLKVSKGTELLFKISSEVKEGKLKIEIKDEKNKVLADAVTNGEYKKTVKINYDGKLFINVIGENTKGYFNISYKKRKSK
ncbi:hypothetical protein [Clostridium sp. Marseille-Q2269]|uniref:hypothetical protein n=1 Tax=Clostridium sp. Marseille-Q2269 TaxID=2942205 RepID=UPI00207429C2|nr:hypothetical protein [Clostridium sp. Marseille-Q2269]